MSKVFVLDTNHQPLNPVHPGEARLLLKQGKAAIWRRFPFTVILKYAVQARSFLRPNFPIADTRLLRHSQHGEPYDAGGVSAKHAIASRVLTIAERKERAGFHPLRSAD